MNTQQFLTDPSILNMAWSAIVKNAHGATGDETSLDLPPPVRGGEDRCAVAASSEGPALQSASANSV